jgi:hypothetical protein
MSREEATPTSVNSLGQRKHQSDGCPRSSLTAHGSQNNVLLMRHTLARYLHFLSIVHGHSHLHVAQRGTCNQCKQATVV